MDNADDLTGILENGTTSLAAYAYDNLGRETLLTRGNATTETPAYDNAANLASLAQDLASSANDNTITLAHNAAAQISARSQSNTAYQWSPSAPGTQSYSANGLNQYSTVASASFTYDTRGNLTSDGAHSFSYDIYNRLLTGPNSAALSYDAGGRLYETSGTGAATTRFLYDGANIIAEYDTSGNLLRRTVHGLSGPILSYDGAGAKTWLIPDERGSIVANDNGASVTINSYDEYGQNGPANAGRFQYVGMPWIGEAGVYQMGARNYAPGIGRWMQADPILTAGGINLYGYVGDDPVNGLDISGLSKTDCHTGTLFCNYIPIGGFSCTGNGCTDSTSQSGGNGSGSGTGQGNDGSGSGGSGSNGSSTTSTTLPPCPGDDICVTGTIPRHRSYEDANALIHLQFLLDTLSDSNAWLIPIQSYTSEGEYISNACVAQWSTCQGTLNRVAPQSRLPAERACASQFMLCQNHSQWMQNQHNPRLYGASRGTGADGSDTGAVIFRPGQPDQYRPPAPPGPARRPN